MKKCPYCGRDNEEQAEVCAKCFARITPEKQEKAVAPEPETVPEENTRKSRKRLSEDK